MSNSPDENINSNEPQLSAMKSDTPDKAGADAYSNDELLQGFNQAATQNIDNLKEVATTAAKIMML